MTLLLLEMVNISTELFAGDNSGVEIIDATPYLDSNTYCCLDVEQIETFSSPIAVHLYIDTSQFGDTWISITNYSKLLTTLNQLEYSSYDNVNYNAVAYTNCTSHSGFCPVCDTEIPYMTEDVVTFSYSRGPMYIHQQCISKLQDALHKFATEYSEELVALTI